MTKSTEYRVGMLSDLIASSGAGATRADFDPDLVSVFSTKSKLNKPKKVKAPAAASLEPSVHKVPAGPGKKLKRLKTRKAHGVNANESINSKTPRSKNADAGKKQKARSLNWQNVKVNVVKEEEDSDEDASEPKSSGPPRIKKDKDESTKVEKSLAERNAPKDKNSELERRTVYVGNVPKNCKRKKVKGAFKEFGKIESIRYRCAAPDKPSKMKKVAMNKQTLHPDQNSIVAFIRFKTREQAEEAAKKGSGMVLNDHHLTVDLADNSIKKDNNKGVFVGNLLLKLSDEELWSFFSDCGQIENVRVVRDQVTGLGKGFGYVNFAEKASVELALQKTDTDLNGRPIRISRVVKKLKNKDRAWPTKPQNRFQGQRSDDSVPTTTAKDNRPTAGKKEKQSPKNLKPSQGQRQRKVVDQFAGDATAEIGKLKRNSKKPNKFELKKKQIARVLTSKPTAVVGVGPKSKSPEKNTKKKGTRYFNTG